MKNIFTRFVNVILATLIIITMMPMLAYAESGIDDAYYNDGAEPIPDNSEFIDSSSNSCISNMDVDPSNSVVFKSNNIQNMYEVDKIISELYTIETGPTHDAITVEYACTQGITMLSQSFFSESSDNEYSIPLRFNTNNALDKKNNSVYNICEDSIVLTVTIYERENSIDCIKKQIWVLTTPYGTFTSDIGQIICKRNYLSYLLTHELVDKATYDNLDRLLHCTEERIINDKELSVVEYSQSTPPYVNSTQISSDVAKTTTADYILSSAETLNTGTRSDTQPYYAKVTYNIVVNVGSVTLSGTVYWYDNANFEHRAQYVNIDIMDEDPLGSHQKLSTTTTDGNGNFYCTIADNSWLETNGLDIYLRVYCGNNQTMVHDLGNIEEAIALGILFSSSEFYFTTTVHTNVTSDINNCTNYCTDEITAQAFSIANALFYARSYEKFINGGELLNNTPVIAHYPSIISELSFSVPIMQRGHIFLAENAHNNWTVIIHEYAHVVQNKLGLFNGLKDGVSILYNIHTFNHSADYKLTDYYNGKKETALYMAWFEGWATYYSMSVQRQYDLYQPSKGYPGTSMFVYDDHNMFTDSGWGEDHEFAVTSALLRTVYDVQLLTPQDIWNLSKNNKPKSYYEMHELIMNEILSDYSIDSNNLHILNWYLNLLEFNDFSPSNLEIDFNSYAPTFSWNSPTYDYTNPKNSNITFNYDYYLHIEASDNDYHYIKHLDDTTTYTPANNEWKQIANSCPNGFYWYVEASEKRTPSESNYMSKCYWSGSKKHTITHDYYFDQYSEWLVALKAEEHCDYHVSFSVDGFHLIQTFGQTDTILELYAADGTPLVTANECDDDGYEQNALISYYFEETTNYILRVKIRSTNTTFTHYTKLAIVTTYPHSSYESAYGPYSTTAVGWSLGVTRVALFRYRFSQSGTVTFTMSSDDDIDTLLFLIDPSSVNLIQEYTGVNTTAPNLYDDDSGGNGQAQIKKQVTANKEYLAIIAFYDPDETGHFKITTTYTP